MSEGDTENKLPRGFLPVWSVSQAPVAVSVVLLMQITYYATEVVGLSPALVGAILMGSKFLDAIVAPFAGFVVDRTNTRWGKGRPFFLFVIPLWICIILLFSTPEIGVFGKAAWVAIMYSLVNSICYTALMISGGVYLKRSLSGSQRQGKVIAVTGVVIMFIAAIGSILLPQLMTRWGTLPGGWTKIGLVYGIPMVVLGMLRFIIIKENADNSEDDTQNKIGILESIKLVMKNKYTLLLAAAGMIENTARNIIAISAAYYFTFIIGDLGSLSLVSAFGIATPLVLLLFPPAMKTIGGMNFVRINLIIAAVFYALLFLAGDNLPAIIACAIVGSIGLNCLAMIGGVFIIQTMDYGEWHTGKRVEGMISSAINFTSKVGNGFASLLGGAVMFFGGYVAQAPVQTPSALMSIRIMYSLIPCVCCICLILVLRFYDLDKKIPGILKDLQERKIQGNA